MSRKKRVTRPLQDKPLADVEKVADIESGTGFDPFPQSEPPPVPVEEPVSEVVAEFNGPYTVEGSGVHDKHGNRCAIGGFDHNREQSGPAYARLIADALNALK